MGLLELGAPKGDKSLHYDCLSSTNQVWYCTIHSTCSSSLLFYVQLKSTTSFSSTNKVQLTLLLLNKVSGTFSDLYQSVCTPNSGWQLPPSKTTFFAAIITHVKTFYKFKLIEQNSPPENSPVPVRS